MKRAILMLGLLCNAAHAQTVGGLPTFTTNPVVSGSCLYADQLTSVTASIAGSTMNVSAVAGGNLAVGDVVQGVAPGTKVTSGSGTTGSYGVSVSQTVASGPLTLRGDRKICSGYAAAMGQIVMSPGALGNFTSATAQSAANPIPNTPDVNGQHLNFVADTGLINGSSQGAGDRQMGTPITVTAISSVTPLMMGLDKSVGTQNTFFTPIRTGRFVIRAGGWVSAFASTYQMRIGTGTPPANGDPVTGTAIGNTQPIVPANPNNRLPWFCVGVATGLTIGTRYWVDMSAASPTGSVPTNGGIHLEAIEE